MRVLHNTEYKKVNSTDLKKYANDDDDMYWGIELRDLALLSSTKLNMKLAKDYYRKCTLPIDDFDNNKSFEGLIRGDYFFHWDGIREEQSSPTEVVFHKNRALVSYYGTDGYGIWVIIKLIVKSRKQLDVYYIQGWHGDTAPVEPVQK